MSVTVCIPTFNRAHLIGRALQCAMGQTYPETKVLVYDDASTDKTWRVVRKLEGPRLRYVRGDSNLKECLVRPAMVDLVDTEYIAWLDSDDLCNKYRVAIQVLAMEEMEALWSRVNANVFRKDHAIDWGERPRSRERLEFITASTVVRTSFAKLHRHRPFLFGCDTVWELEALRNFRLGIVIPRILYYYMMHDPARVSKTYPHRPNFEKEMQEQRAERARLVQELLERDIPVRGKTLGEEYTEGLVARCCS